MRILSKSSNIFDGHNPPKGILSSFPQESIGVDWQLWDADPDTTFYMDADPIQYPDPTLKTSPS